MNYRTSTVIAVIALFIATAFAEDEPAPYNSCLEDSDCNAGHYCKTVRACVTQPCWQECAPLDDVCELPIDIGRTCIVSDGRKIAYYYNKNTKRCMARTFLGCGGNPNRFDSMAECNKTCITKSSDPKVSCPLFPPMVPPPEGCNYVNHGTDENGCLIPPGPELECADDTRECPKNEEWDECDSNCHSTCQNKGPQICDAACHPRCRCMDGMLRDETTGKCVFEMFCPPKEDGTKRCHVANIEAILGQKMFVPECDAQGDYAPMQCDSRGIVLSCWCVDTVTGQELANSRVYSKEAQCAPKENRQEDGCGPNEERVACGTMCPTTCKDILDPPSGPKMCIMSCKVNACQCKEGFVLNKHNNCVPPSECHLVDDITCDNVDCEPGNTCIMINGVPECHLLEQAPSGLSCANVLCVQGTHCFMINGNPECRSVVQSSPEAACKDVQCEADTHCFLINGNPECRPLNPETTIFDAGSCAAVTCMQGTECQMVNGTPECRKISATTKRDGDCPSNNGRFGVCAEMCFGDASCPDGEKCCSNGCGHECMPAVKEENSAPRITCANVRCISNTTCRMIDGAPRCV